MLEQLREWLTQAQLGTNYVHWIAVAIAVTATLAVAALANYVARFILVGLIVRLIRKTRTQWDDALLKRRLFQRLAHIAPALVLWFAAPAVLEDWPQLVLGTQHFAELYMLAVALGVFSSFLNAFGDIYETYPVARRVPIQGYLQVVMILATVSMGIVALSLLVGRSPLFFLSGLGALTAVLLLVFRDPILGLVAGVVLAANDMVRPGDWIEMPKYGADGEVIEVTLTTVKVRNWDKTIANLPTYSLISDSFKNWRGMEESGGRRIKRAIHIDVNSVAFCTPELLERLGAIELIAGYIRERRDEIDTYNREQRIDGEGSPINGRRMTNLGTFRAYVVAYLKQHPQIHGEDDMTFLVRQLAPTERGIPLEIYVFSKDQRWAYYEGIQSDIFDHLYAALPQFGLRPFQLPGGADLSSLGAGPRPASEAS